MGVGTEAACQYAVAADVSDGAVADVSALGIFMEFHSRRGAMREGAAEEVHVFGTVHADGCRRTAYPSLVVELMVAVGAYHLWSQLICLSHIHACLERGMTADGWSHPCGMAEGDAFEGDVTHGIVGGAAYAEQGLHGRSLNICRRHILALEWDIVYFLFPGIEIPLSGSVEQRLVVGEIEGGVVAVGCHHRRWPGVHEMDVAFGLMEGDGGAVALYSDALDAQVCHTPHLMYHHLGMTGMEYLSDGCCRNIECLVLLVDASDAIHVLEVAHISGSHCLSAVYPQLAELQRTTIKLGHIGYVCLALLLPSRYLHSAAHHSIAVGYEACAAVFGPHRDGLVQPVGACLEADGHVFGSLHAARLSCLLQCLLYGVGSWLHHNVGGEGYITDDCRKDYGY